MKHIGQGLFKGGSWTEDVTISDSYNKDGEEDDEEVEGQGLVGSVHGQGAEAEERAGDHEGQEQPEADRLLERDEVRHVVRVRGDRAVPLEAVVEGRNVKNSPCYAERLQNA